MSPNLYDSSTIADTILRSSDKIDFYIIGALLRYVSPVFQDMFALGEAREDNETKDNLPIILLSESSRTLRLLLDLIYPHEQYPQIDKVTAFRDVSKTSQKYGMNVIENKLKRQIVNSNLTTRVPLSVYAIAIELGWEEVALNAARRTLRTPLQNLTCNNELRNITGVGFYRYVEYRLRCEKSSNPQQEGLAAFPPRNLATMTTAPTDESFSPLALLSEVPGDTVPPPPFAPSATANLILRSSDAVDFFIADVLIRLASPVLDRMLPVQDPAEPRDGLPVIQLDEDSIVLHRLLNIIYPSEDVGDIQDCQLLARVALAAKKYEMLGVVQRLRKQAISASLVTTQPLRIYAVASALGWWNLAKAAALNTLTQPLEEMTYIDEFQLMTGADLCRLVQFRFKCADAACNALKGNTKFTNYGFGSWTSYYKNNMGMYRLAGPDRKRVDMLYEKLRACPRGSTVTNLYNQELAEIAKQEGKYEISLPSFSDILTCMQDAPRVVEKAVLKVFLDSSGSLL